MVVWYMKRMATSPDRLTPTQPAPTRDEQRAARHSQTALT